MPEKAEEETRKWAARAGMKTAGHGVEPVEMTARGMRLAFLAADDVSAPVDRAALINAVAEARASGAYVVVSMHWGLEYQAGQTKRQTQLAAELAEAGANLIVGHHPHVIQPVECIETAGREGTTLVFYSLGNALFDQRGLPDTREGQLALVRLSPGGLADYSMVPFQIERHGSQYRLKPGPAAVGFCPP